MKTFKMNFGPNALKEKYPKTSINIPIKLRIINIENILLSMLLSLFFEK